MVQLLQTKQLGKTIKGKVLVHDVHLEVNKGKIYGLLGPNGAGKTTLMKMITGMVRPTMGEIQLFDEPFTHRSFEVLKRMGNIIEYPIFYDHLTARKNLEIHCAYMEYNEKHAVDEALGLVNLQGIEGKAVKHFSLGMKQRLGIARAIVTKPEILLLDEPINGLDPAGIREMRTLFRTLSRDCGITLIVSSHILNEIEQVADTIGIIKNGKLIEQVSMEAIRNKQTEYLKLITADRAQAIHVLKQQFGIIPIIDNDGTIRMEETGFSQSEIVKTLSLNGVAIESIARDRDSLEDYFLKIMDGVDQSA